MFSQILVLYYGRLPSRISTLMWFDGWIPHFVRIDVTVVAFFNANTCVFHYNISSALSLLLYLSIYLSVSLDIYVSSLFNSLSLSIFMSLSLLVY